MRLDSEVEHDWENVISTIDKDHVPINCVKKVLFKLKGGKQKTINLARLRKDGLDLEQIEEVVTRQMIELSAEIVNMDFVIDINVVRETVQPLTNELLKNL
jgi:glycerate-2-kinase